MLSLVTDKILQFWVSSRRIKVAPNGWITGNAPCCPHNGETLDTKGRGGVFIDHTNGKLIYHCFNCGFSTAYIPGRILSRKMKLFLKWIGIDEGTVAHLAIEALRVREWITRYQPEIEIKIPELEDISFKKTLLPNNFRLIIDALKFYTSSAEPVPKMLEKCVKYAIDRRIDIEKYGIGWDYSNPDRIIIPFKWKNEIIGYCSRTILENAKSSKYINRVDTGYVFNVDAQRNRKVCILSEGPIDAMSIDGIATLRNTISEKQLHIIDSIGAEIIVVPDNDHAGAVLIDYALEYGWNVSFPFWFEDKSLKDINDAVRKYGKVFVMKSILDGTESGSTKIQIQQKKFGILKQRKKHDRIY